MALQAIDEMILHPSDVDDSNDILRVYSDFRPYIIFAFQQSGGEAIGSILCTLAKIRMDGTPRRHIKNEKRHLRLAKWLLKDGAKIDRKDSKRKTAGEYAKENGEWELYELMNLTGSLPFLFLSFSLPFSLLFRNGRFDERNGRKRKTKN